MGFFFVKTAISTIHNPMPGAQPHRPGDVTSKWLPFGIGLVIALGGLYVLINPEPLVQWTLERLFSERRVSGGTLRTWRVALRVMGALMIYSSTDLFRLCLRR
jgi:hypothetical protein